MDPITDVAIIFVTATILAFVSRLIKQPIIPAYIIAGVILILTGVIETNGLVDTIALLGIAFLLFLVGLEIDFNRLKDVGLVSTVGCTILCTILFGLGFVIAAFFGLSLMSAIYVGLVVAFSSTMIVVKLLSDKNQLDTLHGRIILGVLLMQDLLAILALFVLSTITTDGFSFMYLLNKFSLLLILFLVAYLLSKYVFPILFKFAAKTEELLFITSVSACLLFIGVFHYFGFSIIIGSFLAGIALANLHYNLEIIALIKPIRDFFAVVFFVSLGMLLNIEMIRASVILIVVLTILTISVKPFLIMLIVSLFGYKPKPSFFSAISLAQASEFGLILLLAGLSMGHIGKDLFSAVVVVTILTMTLTAYLFEYKSAVYGIFHKYFGFLERKSGIDREYGSPKIKKDVLMVGYDRLGYNIFDTLRKQKRKFIVVDYNPEVIKNLVRKKIPCLYGDIGDMEILHRLDLKNIEMIISTAPDKLDSLMLIKKSKEANPKAVVIVTSMNIDDAVDLYEAGADYVILPHFLGGERVSLLLEEVKGDGQKMLEYKITHLKELKRRKMLKHRHPRRHK